MEFRVRYSETDQMGTFYNSRALEWFECARTELLRAAGRPYTQWEAEGIMLPLTEAHVQYMGRARYDDLLRMTSCATMPTRARVRVDVDVTHADDARPVCCGYTIHAVTDADGRPIRPPQWLTEMFSGSTEVVP
jgi:acyl-CoA thioester hydrolase